MGKERLEVLALEPYFAGSHKAVLDGLCGVSGHDFALLEMPARKWKWRMRAAAIEFAERARLLSESFDLVFANDMMSVADWCALAPSGLARLPVVTYFHENQLTYPLRQESERDYQYGFTNITTCLASDEVWFNSEYHRNEFLDAVQALLSRMPDCIPHGVVEKIRKNSYVVYPGIDVPCGRAGARRSPPTLLWNHRWEWDKNPEEFFEAVEAVRARGVDFRLAVAGEIFRETPAVFTRAREDLADVIVHWGHIKNRDEYLKLISKCDVVVSTAWHEFFGVAVLEAAAAGCVPLLPRRLSYPEIFAEGSEGVVFYENGRLVDRLAALLCGDSLPAPHAAKALARPYLWANRIGQWDSAFRRAARNAQAAAGP